MIDETRSGLASKFHVKCTNCGFINKVATSAQHRSATHGPPAFDVNSRTVLGSLHIGIGQTQINNLLSTINIPTINISTFKKREREVGKATETLAKKSCKESIAEEREKAILAGENVDENGLIGLPVSYDMGWQKRGKGHNSLTGQGTAMGLSTGNVLSYATRNKACRVCSHAKKQNTQPREHDCRKNHAGSSKAMEPSVACQLWNEAPKQNVKFSTFVGDDDTTTQAHLHQNVPYGVEKWSDIVHTKRSLTTRLYNLASRSSFPNSSPLSQKVINYLTKCFSYAIAQNSDVESLKLALKCIIPHAFGDHTSCDASWCGYLKEGTLYKHRSLPYNKDLYGQDLKKALTVIFNEYATDTVAQKLIPFANSQRNESLNGIIGSKNPKIKFYGGSESNDFRVACAVNQKNIGYSYISKTLESLGIDPGENCKRNNIIMDKKREKDKARKSTKTFKIRRHQLQAERLLSNNKIEAKEGKTYETGIGLNLNVENSPATAATIQLPNATHKQLEEFEKSVPTCMERPSKQYLKHGSSSIFKLVFFDLETTGTGKKAEICQLSAVNEIEETFSCYILPQSSISPSASRVNNLTIEMINGKRTLCKNAYPVQTSLLPAVLQSFFEFLQSNTDRHVNTILLGHNSCTFDVPTLLRTAGQSFINNLHSINLHFGDTLPLFRDLLKRKHSPLQLSSGEFCKSNQSSIYQCLFHQDFEAHDAIEDVIALKKIIFSSELAIDLKTVINGCQVYSVHEAEADLYYLDKRHSLLQTFIGNLYRPNDANSPITHGMAQKLAGSGLSYDNLMILYRKYGTTGIVAVLSMAPTTCHDGRPRVTKNKRILGRIVQFFESNVSSIQE